MPRQSAIWSKGDVLEAVRVPARRFAFLALVSALVLLFAWSAYAAQTWAADEPLLTIDTGGHTDRIRAPLAFVSNTMLVSASDDKTVRIWNLETGKTDRIIRGQSWLGVGGALYALALSPDGKTLAVAGNLAKTSDVASQNCGDRASCGDIRLIDLANPAAPVRRLRGGHTNIVFDLAFSPDGKLLASTGPDRKIHIWTVTSGEKREPAITVKDEYARKVLFLPDSRHLAFSTSTRLGVIDLANSLNPDAVDASILARFDQPLIAMAVSADGRRIAVGGSGKQLSIWRWPQRTKEFDVPVPADVGALAFGRKDTAALLVATAAEVEAKSSGEQQTSFTTTVWDVSAPPAAPIVSLPVHDNASFAAVFSPDGKRIATAGGDDWSIRVWEPRSAALESMQVLAGRGRAVWSVGFVQENLKPGVNPENASRVVESIGWGYQNPCPELDSCPTLPPGPLQYVMQIPSGPATFLDDQPDVWPRTAVGSTGIAGTRRIRQPQLSSDAGTLDHETAGKNKTVFPRLVLDRAGQRTLLLPRGLDRSSDHTSFSFDSTGKLIASGGRNGVLDVLAADGSSVRPLLKGHTGNVWSVAFDEKSRLLLTGGGDQILCLWNPQTGELIASLLFMPRHRPDEDADWVMWTPQGYFAASPGGEDAVGWLLERGPDRPAELVTGRQLREYFYQPLLIGDAISLGSATGAISAARDRGELSDFNLETLQDQSPPRLNIIAPKPRERLQTPTTKLRLQRLGPPVDKIDVSVNGQTVDASKWTQHQPEGGAPAIIELDVGLRHGPNVIEVVAHSGKLLSRRETVEVVLSTEGALDAKGTLRILAIGVNEYTVTGCGGSGKSCNLRFADNDALAFANKVHTLVGGTGFSATPLPVVLANGKHVAGQSGVTPPTKANISAALAQLAQSKDEDTVVLFIAGHGVNTSGGYRFLPADAAMGANREIDPASAVTWQDIRAALGKAKGAKLLFVDTCHSALAFGGDGIVNDATNDGAVIFVASGGEQKAIESPPHGVFTRAVLQGLDGAADFLPKIGEMTVNELGTYVTEIGKEMAREISPNSLQEPRFQSPLTRPNFVLVRK